MNLLIISDNDSNQLYNSIESGSIGYYPNVKLDDLDYSRIVNNVSKIKIIALITNAKGLGKLLFASLSKIEKNNNAYDLTYIISHVVSSEIEISNFNRAFPYAFKEEKSAKLSNSKELIKIFNFFDDSDDKKCRKVSNDMKSIIINCDSFRLLSAKAEVFRKENEDGVHSRLSHCVRVKYIADKIANQLEESGALKIDYDLIDNITLASNIGHTPYGIVGEQVIGEILQGKYDYIPNIDMIGLKYFRHSIQSARMLERVEPVASKNNCIDLSVIAGIIAHTKLNFDANMYNNEAAINKYLAKYFINYKNLLGEYAIVSQNNLIPKSLEAQIVIVADEIASKTYDLELAIRGDIVESNEITTRLKLLSEVTGEEFEYDFTTHNSRYYTSRKVSQYIVDYLIESACDSFKFEKYRSSNKIENYIGFSEPGIIVLEMINNYFQSKLLLSRKVRLHDHKSRQIINDIFREIYNDINLLPNFHRNRVVEEFYNEGLKDINILLCFISFNDGRKYLNDILYSDIKLVRNKQEQLKLIRKREIIIQAIIDYIVCLSDNDAQALHESLVHK